MNWRRLVLAFGGLITAAAVSGAAIIGPPVSNGPPAPVATGNSAVAQAIGMSFEGCGELFQGVECILFAADEGGVYFLENMDGFGVGDRVLVSGVLDPDCFTACLEGDGCIFENTIEACGPEPFAGCGELFQGVECILFAADEGGVYLLENMGDFDVGDSVFVAGLLDPDCFTICLEEDGCIFGNMILSCDPGEKVTICHIPPGNPAGAHEITVSINALPAHLAHGDTIGPCQPPAFEGCGTLIQGVECVLFQADEGGLYLLENLDGFGVGDRVLVTGVPDPDCFTICQEEDGCIFGNTIEACVEPFEGCGSLVQGVECVLFQADAGGLYLLDNLNGFGVGDRVFVTGTLDPGCITICLAGDGCIIGTTIEACVESFAGCGSLVQGVECVLFQADAGGLYLLDNLDGFGVGDRVYVTGTADPTCVTICQEEDGCIFGNTIDACPFAFDGCGTLVQGVECVLFAPDAGGLWLLDNLGGFGVGDRVYVTGMADPTCFTGCQQGDGCILGNTIDSCPYAFDGCGTLVQGVECVLFEADAGGLWLLDDLGGFGVGDRVYVTGMADPTCNTICLEGDGCIFGNTIDACPFAFDGCGTLVQGVECVLFEADAGGLWLLDDLGGFGVGDRVYVTGMADPTCFTTCQEEDGCIFGNTIDACPFAFDGCGTLVQGVECVLFEADAGGLWLLDDLGGFGVGDRVYVTGMADPTCFTICQEEDGCIFGNTIDACPFAFDGCGTLVQGVECVLFEADAGGLWLLDDLGGFGVGDRVYVTGMADPTCNTICLEGDGCIFGNTIDACPFAFDGCGTLVQGVECVLFQADLGGLWLLENLGGFDVGDQVFVTGLLDPGCFTICQEEDGCIFENMIIGECP